MDFDAVNPLNPEAEAVKLTSLKPETEGSLCRQYKSSRPVLYTNTRIISVSFWELYETREHNIFAKWWLLCATLYRPRL
jgi:hypothetical protein